MHKTIASHWCTRIVLSTIWAMLEIGPEHSLDIEKLPCVSVIGFDSFMDSERTDVRHHQLKIEVFHYR